LLPPLLKINVGESNDNTTKRQIDKTTNKLTLQNRNLKTYQNLLLLLKFEQFKRKTHEEFEELSKNVTKNRPVQCPPREHVNKFLQLVKARFDLSNFADSKGHLCGRESVASQKIDKSTNRQTN
jgi:hypothetical protein